MTTVVQVRLVWYWEGPVRRYFIPTDQWRSSRELSLWLLQKGSVELLWEHGSRVVKAGHWIMPPPIKRNERFRPDAEVISLRFELADDLGFMPFAPEEPVVFRAASARPLGVAVRALRGFLCGELGMDPRRKIENLALPLRQSLRVNALAASVFAEFMAQMEIRGMNTAASAELSHPGLHKAVSYLESRDLSRPLRERDVAGMAGLSLPHLRRLFREQLGTTIKVWDGRRLDRGVRGALAGKRMSVKETAFAHGFSSPSHFCRWFRANHDCTPGQWLAGARADGSV